MPTASQTIAQANLSDAQALCQWLVSENGYLDAKILTDGSVAGITNLLYTRAICLGCHWDGWANRFCFEDRSLADRRFAELLSEDDVPSGHIATRSGFGRALPIESDA